MGITGDWIAVHRGEEARRRGFYLEGEPVPGPNLGLGGFKDWYAGARTSKIAVMRRTIYLLTKVNRTIPMG
jgi:hypothetical protein